MDAIEAARRTSNGRKVLAYFKAHPGKWIGTRMLEKVGGRNAWRTRVSDARHVVTEEGGVILNRQQRTRGQVISQYIYLPQAPHGRDASTYVNQKSLF